MKICVVTGASSGMGREFVLQLSKTAQEIDEFWVIARRAEKLQELSALISQKVRPIPMDLTNEASFSAYQTLLEEQKPEVKILVNASGFGKFGKFTEVSLEEQNNMIDLNVKAYVRMTYLTLPYMPEGSEIYQLDSISAFQPIPAINIYAATKAFILSFSRALNMELKPRGIHVLAVCPFWVKTEFFDRAVIDDTVKYYAVMYRAEDVVARAIKDMKKRGRDVSVCGKYAKMQAMLVKILPHKMVMKTWMKQQKIK